MNAIFYAVQNHMDFGRGLWISGADNISEEFSKRHQKYGCSKFEDLLEEKGANVINLDRKSAVSIRQ